MKRRGPYDILPHAVMQVKYLHPRIGELFQLNHAKPGDAGYDLAYAPPNYQPPLPSQDITIFPGCFKLVPTGVAVKIPAGYVGILCGRSSTFGKRGIFVVEARIDSGYTGELFAKVWHPGVSGGDFQTAVQPAVIRPYERVAQLVILPYLSPKIEAVDELPETERGNSGFGSSGL